MVSIACSLNQDDRAERSERWLTLGSRALVQIVPTDAGLALVFPAAGGAALAPGVGAARPRDCCAFASWTVRADAERVVLDVAGDGEAVPVIQGMFDSLRGSAPTK
jgi:hypothetical protein